MAKYFAWLNFTRNGLYENIPTTKICQSTVIAKEASILLDSMENTYSKPATKAKHL